MISIENKENLEFDDYGNLSRIRSIRRRVRAQRKDVDKMLIRMDKEETKIHKQISDLGWTELHPPIQRGFIRTFVLRDDVKRTKQAQLYQKILDKINVTQWSYRKDFKKKRKKYGTKIYVVREQNLRDVQENEFFDKEFTELERSFFYETLTHLKFSKKAVKVYRFAETWRFVLRIQPNMITKVRSKDFDLERKRDEIDAFFNSNNRRYRLSKLLHGVGWKWKWERRPKAKYLNPFVNKWI
jgi:hypothetical protein